jgi:hypothetical protein
MNRKILIATFIILISAGLVLFNKSEPIKAGTGHNVSGWAWSENIGWISFNSINCDTDGNGTSDGSTGCPPNGTPISNYGVSVVTSADNSVTLSGYAWSENIGWIKFDPAGPYPRNNPNHSAKIESATTVTGWARACAGTVNGDCNSATRNDGWDGWISLSGTTTLGSNYGVEIDITEAPDQCYLKGYAWGSDVVGWIRFSSGDRYRVKVPCLQTITTTLGTPSIKSIDEPDYCTSSFVYTINWNSVEGADSYKIEICDNTSGGTCSFYQSNGPAYTINEGILDYNKTYNLRVRAEKQDGSSYSNWSASVTLTTIPHKYPDKINIEIPSTISVGQKVEIKGYAECYGGCSWQWSFENFEAGEYNINGPTNQQNIYVTFNKAFDSNSNRKITLKVTDSDSNDHSCSLSKQINVKPKWPTWVEVKPF